MKILYIEDNPVDIDLTRRKLKKESPHIQMPTAKSQAEALRIIRSPEFSDYDLVLTDMHLQDGDGIAEMNKQILEHLGYSVTIRTDSIEALDLFRKMSAFFDLLITDMTMPTMTGDQLATRIMAIRQDLPVILCTGYSRKIFEETASKIGIRAFAYKPIIRADLARTVRRALDESQGATPSFINRENIV